MAAEDQLQSSMLGKLKIIKVQYISRKPCFETIEVLERKRVTVWGLGFFELEIEG